MREKSLKVLAGLLIVTLQTGSIWSQSISSADSVDCDSLYKSERNIQSEQWLEKAASPMKSLAEIQNELTGRVDSNLFVKNVIIKILIDTSGYVLCPKIVKGNNNIIDTIAADIVSSLKFNPAENRSEKLPMVMAIPFYCNKIKETNTLIKRNGKWYDK